MAITARSHAPYEMELMIKMKRTGVAAFGGPKIRVNAAAPCAREPCDRLLQLTVAANTCGIRHVPQVDRRLVLHVAIGAGGILSALAGRPMVRVEADALVPQPLSMTIETGRVHRPLGVHTQDRPKVAKGQRMALSALALQHRVRVGERPGGERPLARELGCDAHDQEPQH